MKKISLLLAGMLSFGAICASNSFNLNNETAQMSDEIVGTISKNTTEKQFESLIGYFKDNGIKLDISEVNYNKQDEITGIKILLQKGTQKSRYAMSSNVPIADLELGSRDGNLFITTKGNINSGQISSIMSEFQNATSSIDSLLAEHPFSFTFNSDQLRDLLNGAEIDMDAFSNNLFGNQSNNNAVPNKKPGAQLPKYSFINNPSIDKLIIIDGEESNFETLDNLAKADQLIEVDNLKPATAISIYGDKAKDGAIIATTK